jgi:phage gp29-like protein
MADALGPMIDRGLEVDQAEIRDKFGLSAPKAGAKLMGAKPPPAPPGNPEGAAPTDPDAPESKIKGQSGEIKRGDAPEGTETALNAERPSGGPPTQISPEEALASRMQAEAALAMEAMLDQIEAMLERATSLPELREMLVAGFPYLDADSLAQVLAMGLMAAEAGGRVAAAIEAE